MHYVESPFLHYVLLPFPIALQCDAQVLVRHVFFGGGNVVHSYFRYESFARKCEINSLVRLNLTNIYVFAHYMYDSGKIGF